MAEERFEIMEPIEEREFLDSNISIALANCQKEGAAMFMNELIKEMINSSADPRIWQVGYTTQSLKATGRTLRGKKVVVYYHRPNYLSDPQNTAGARKDLINYAARIPQKFFQALVDSDEETDKSGDRLVWVVDYETLKKAKKGVLSIDSALEHPQTIPFIGGESLAIEFLKKRKEIYGIKISNSYCDDFIDESPLGRMLAITSGNYGGLISDYGLNSPARFLRKCRIAEGKPVKKTAGRTSLIAAFARSLLAWAK